MSHIRDGLVREVVALRQRDELLTAALKQALAAMSIAHSIWAVRAEYDFEPAIRQAAAALRTLADPGRPVPPHGSGPVTVDG